MAKNNTEHIVHAQDWYQYGPDYWDGIHCLMNLRLIIFHLELPTNTRGV